MRQQIQLFLGLVLILTLLVGCGGTATTPTGVAQPRQNHQTQPTVGSAAAPTISAARPTAPASHYEPAQGGAPMVAPDSMELRGQGGELVGPSTGGTDIPNGKPYDATFYEDYGTNPFIDTEDDRFSTFAMDVDTASYNVMRRYLTDGNLPDPASVRVEEVVNAFDYQYPQPAGGEDFGITMEGAPAPFGTTERYELLMIGIQGREVSAIDRKPAALTFVIDVSGSMAMENRLGSVKHALTMVAEQMRQDDTIAIVVYGSSARVVLEPTSGAEKGRIISAIENLQSEGSTNAQDGLRLGFQQAEQGFKADGINMVMLCSDGVANNGITDAEGLLKLYQASIDRGVQLSTFGFGMGNYNDVLMEQLANQGDGIYAYVDSHEEAERVFVEQLTGTLQTIARDAKIQVEFNPAVVSRYRLLGYENRDVADEDFRNDTVDAGEVGAGHSVTALYEIKRIEGAQGSLANVQIRYQPADGGDVVEIGRELFTDELHSDISRATPRLQLAASVAQYAEILSESYWSKGEPLAAVLPLAESAAESFQDPQVDEFVDLLRQAIQLKPDER